MYNVNKLLFKRTSREEIAEILWIILAKKGYKDPINDSLSRCSIPREK